MIRALVRAAGAARFSFFGHKKECLSEMLGTYLLVFIGPATVVVASTIPRVSPFESLTLVALVFGCTVASIILLLSRHSGAHINPAITVASTLAGMSRKELFFPYLVFQIAGGLLAGLSLKIVLGGLPSSTYLGSTRLGIGVTPLEGVALEIVGTFVLATSALLASSSVSSPMGQATLVGSTLFVLIMFIGPLTGASFNPARSLGPSIFSRYLSSQLVYWVGPLVGALLAGLLFGVLKSNHGQS